MMTTDELHAQLLCNFGVIEAVNVILDQALSLQAIAKLRCLRRTAFSTNNH